MLAQLLRTTARRASQASLACRLVAPVSKSFATDAAAAAQKPSGGGGGVVRRDAPHRLCREAAHPVVGFSAVQAAGMIFPVVSCLRVCAPSTKCDRGFKLVPGNYQRSGNVLFPHHLARQTLVAALCRRGCWARWAWAAARTMRTRRACLMASSEQRLWRCGSLSPVL